MKNHLSANYANMPVVEKHPYSTTSNIYMDFFPIEKKNFFLWNIMIYFNQKYIDLKKSIVFCKYIVFIILQNEPIQLGNHQFACPFCTKIMKLKADVKRHIRTHTGEKPYACKFCPYRSSQKGTLQYHVQHIHGDFSN